MPQNIRVCIDRILADELYDQAAKKSIEVNPKNVPPDVIIDPKLEIAVEIKWLWKPGQTLRVCFLDGDSIVQQRVEEFARQWSECANIKFDFGDHEQAEIRISFKGMGVSWSWIGTQALAIEDQNEPTMNFGWLYADSPDDVYSGVVLHEFGHALGCIHEHQHPKHPIPWNKDAVYDYYAGPPNHWSKQDVKYNVLDKYSQGQTQYSEFDSHSIMLYPIPNQHTHGDWSVEWENIVLSDTDKEFMRCVVYPFPGDEG